jgi:dTDP-4-dehydrorhamnose reductase
MILVFGATGQVGQSLRDTQPRALDVRFVDRLLCDLAVPGSVVACLDEYTPELIINAAAYTAVDQAEEASELAYRINAHAVEEMARWTAENSARLIHLSTDFVFDGSSTSPCLPGDKTKPLGEYGASKLAGELAALDAAPEQTMIIRTAWVYSEHGSNFVKTMLRLMGERDALGVVSDQRGSPTYARGLAEVIWDIVNGELFEPGIYHWTDAGDITWREFAVAIQEEAMNIGLLQKDIPINAITTDEYPTPAERPAYSVLDTGKLARRLGHEPRPWRENLQTMLACLV